MTESELVSRALEEAEGLGQEPVGPGLALWREVRWGAVVLLAGLGDDDPELLRKASRAVVDPEDTLARALLGDAALLAELGA